jgi:hypothetical protein
METQYTQGEYVNRHSHKHLGVGIIISAKVKKKALEISTEQKVKPRYRMASRGIKALTLSKSIWEEAYKILDDGA